MKIHFNLKPCGINGHGNNIPCEFDWDEDTGEVTGPDADFLLEYKERDGLHCFRPCAGYQ
jgi:hypothetical protein